MNELTFTPQLEASGSAKKMVTSHWNRRCHNHSRDYIHQTSRCHNHSQDYTDETSRCHNHSRDYTHETSRCHNHSRDYTHQTSRCHNHSRDYIHEISRCHNYSRDYIHETARCHNYSRDNIHETARCHNHLRGYTTSQPTKTKYVFMSVQTWNHSYEEKGFEVWRWFIWLMMRSRGGLLWTLMNLLFPSVAQDFVSRWETVSFSRRTPLHGVC